MRNEARFGIEEHVRSLRNIAQFLDELAKVGFTTDIVNSLRENATIRSDVLVAAKRWAERRVAEALKGLWRSLGVYEYRTVPDEVLLASDNPTVSQGIAPEAFKARSYTSNIVKVQLKTERIEPSAKWTMYVEMVNDMDCRADIYHFPPGKLVYTTGTTPWELKSLNSKITVAQMLGHF